MTIDPSGTRDRTGSSLLGQMSDCSGLKGVKQLCRPQACQPSIGDHFPPQCINIHLLVPLWVILVWPGANMWFLGRLNCFVGAFSTPPVCADGLVAKVSPTTGNFRGSTLVEGTFAALATNIITVEVGAEASGVPTTGAKNPTAATDCCGRWWCRPLQVLRHIRGRWTNACGFDRELPPKSHAGHYLPATPPYEPTPGALPPHPPF